MIRWRIVAYSLSLFWRSKGDSNPFLKCSSYLLRHKKARPMSDFKLLKSQSNDQVFLSFAVWSEPQRLEPFLLWTEVSVGPCPRFSNLVKYNWSELIEINNRIRPSNIACMIDENHLLHKLDSNHFQLEQQLIMYLAQWKMTWLQK